MDRLRLTPLYSEVTHDSAGKMIHGVQGMIDGAEDPTKYVNMQSINLHVTHLILFF